MRCFAPRLLLSVTNAAALVHLIIFSSASWLPGFLANRIEACPSVSFPLGNVLWLSLAIKGYCLLVSSMNLRVSNTRPKVGALPWGVLFWERKDTKCTLLVPSFVTSCRAIFRQSCPQHPTVSPSRRVPAPSPLILCSLDRFFCFIN